MLAKCFNSTCSASFRFLHSGKLFRFEKRPQTGAEHAFSPKPWSEGEFFWLCADCATEYELIPDGQQGVRVVPLGRATAHAAS